jgi:bifunctional NMN adenylyltransferase/nudix hydrolase
MVSTGIIVGRFQSFEVNVVHQRLIQEVRDKHSRITVFLCSNPAPHDRNILDVEVRMGMFEEVYGDAFPLLEMPDLPDDRIWSQELDRRIMESKPEGKVTLYGTQANFVARYSGRFETQVLEMDVESDTTILLDPEKIVGFPVNDRSFRAGIFYATAQRFPTVYPTVDIAVFRNSKQELMLARKPNETKYRFPGGFTDPEDESFEEAAMRELFEESGIFEVDDFVYVGSARILDWRYRDSSDTIITHLYACTLLDGEAVASDDIAELRWFDMSRISPDIFVPEHRELLNLLLEYMAEEEEEY